MTKHTCEKKVLCGGPWNSRYETCGRPAKVEHEGHYYCGIHDPVKKASRQAARDEQRDRERDEENRVRRLHDAAEDMLTALKEAKSQISAISSELDVPDCVNDAIAKAEGRQ